MKRRDFLKAAPVLLIPGAATAAPAPTPEKPLIEVGTARYGLGELEVTPSGKPVFLDEKSDFALPGGCFRRKFHKQEFLIADLADGPDPDWSWKVKICIKNLDNYDNQGSNDRHTWFTVFWGQRRRSVLNSRDGTMPAYSLDNGVVPYTIDDIKNFARQALMILLTEAAQKKLLKAAKEAIQKAVKGGKQFQLLLREV